MLKKSRTSKYLSSDMLQCFERSRVCTVNKMFMQNPCCIHVLISGAGYEVGRRPCSSDSAMTQGASCSWLKNFITMHIWPKRSTHAYSLSLNNFIAVHTFFRALFRKIKKKLGNIIAFPQYLQSFAVLAQEFPQAVRPIFIQHYLYEKPHS
jgi:hypothetical protein